MNSTDTTQRTNPVSLADEQAVKQVLTDSVLGLWDVVNNLTRLKPSRDDRYRVTNLWFSSRQAWFSCLRGNQTCFESTGRVGL
jgi:hypothetical protein